MNTFIDYISLLVEWSTIVYIFRPNPKILKQNYAIAKFIVIRIVRYMNLKHIAI